MKYPAIATDYDGTLATDGSVTPQTLEALQTYRDRGGTLFLVTGRELDDLLQVFPAITIFHGVIAENGAVLYHPHRQQVKLLAEPFPPVFAQTLREQGVSPISQGRVVIATWQPHQDIVQQTIQQLSLEATVILNKRAVMVLPKGINKASGLAAALQELHLSADQIVGIGDAENDQSLLKTCGYGVAVSNALPSLKAIADRVTEGTRGDGVQEVISWLLEETL